MQFEESRSIRSFVGRVEPGDDVIEALTLVCEANDVSSALVRLTGTLRDVELVRFEPGSRDYVTLVDHAGPFDIVHLSGQMAKLGDQSMLRADALLATWAPGGQQLVFGQLRRGVAEEAEFVLETFEDLEIERRLDAASGRFPIASVERTAAPTPRAEPAPAPPPRERREPETISEPAGTAAGAQKSDVSWADAMQASEEIKPASQRTKPPLQKPATERSAEDVYADYDFDEPFVKAGDILDHPKLGECRVIKVEDDEYAHIRLSRGQIRKLALEVIELRYDGERDGKNVFKVRVRK